MAGEVKTVEVDGITLELPEERFIDMDFTEAVCAMLELEDEGTDVEKMAATVKFVKSFLGPDYNRVKKAIRAAKGTVTIADMSDFCQRASEAVAKN